MFQFGGEQKVRPWGQKNGPPLTLPSSSQICKLPSNRNYSFSMFSLPRPLCFTESILACAWEYFNFQLSQCLFVNIAVERVPGWFKYSTGCQTHTQSFQLFFLTILKLSQLDSHFLLFTCSVLIVMFFGVGDFTGISNGSWSLGDIIWNIE